MRKNLFERDNRIISALNRILLNAPPDINKLSSTRILKETLPQGIAFHHAGLLPIMKEAIEELFGQGLIRVLYATETFAVGINMPAKTVCFDSLRKFDGFNFRPLNTKEYFQIAGRAGRRGIDKEGFVVSMIYRPTFQYNEVKRITAKDIEPIKSQFKLSVNTVLNLLHLHTPSEIEHILRLSFFSYQKFGENFDEVPTQILLARYNSIVRKLEKLDYVRDGKLTEKGVFSSKIFADEITLGEIFGTTFYQMLDEYQILLILASIVYEPKEMNKFKVLHREQKLAILKGLLHKSEYLAKEKKFLELDVMTCFIHPLSEGKTFFDLIDVSSLQEGDLIRFFGQILDRIGQIKKATSNYDLRRKMENCQGIVEKGLEGIYLV